MRRRGRTIWSSLVTLALLLTLLPAGALAADTAQESWIEAADTTWYEENPSADLFELGSAAQLAGLAQLVNGGAGFSGQTVALTADIDLEGVEWTPIGGGGSGGQFLGIFDGRGHTISNLKITRGLSYTPENRGIALFGATQGGEIRDFTLHNAQVTGSGCVAAVVGGDTFLESRITGVHVTGRVQILGFWYAGGILGNGYTSVTDCSVSGDGADTSYVKITGGYAGGVVGYMGEGSNVIAGCQVEDLTVEGAYNGIGGISGILHYGNTIRDCTAGNVVVWQTSGPDAEHENRIYCGAFGGTYLDNGGTAVPTLEGCTFTGRLYSGAEKTDILAPDRYVGDLWYDAQPPAAVNIRDCTIRMPAAAQVDGREYDTLAQAVAAARSGDTVVLLSDAVLAGGYSDPDAGLELDKSLTIDGRGHTISTGSFSRGIRIYGGGSPEEMVTVTFRNVSVTSAVAGGRCVDTRGGSLQLVLDGAELRTTGAGNTQVLTIGGSHQEKTPVLIQNGSRLSAGVAGYGIVVFNPVNMTIEDSAVSGYGALYFKGPTSSAGAAGSLVAVRGGAALSSTGIEGGSNEFATVVFEDNDIALSIESAALSAATQAADTRQAVFGFSSVTGNRISISGKASCTLTGSSAAFTGQLPQGNSVSITGGAFNFDPAPYVAEGYRVTAGAGQYTVTRETPSGGGSSSGSSSGNRTETVNPDGSTTTTVTRPDGTVTETTTDTAGNKTETVTNTDGSSQTTVSNTDGSSSATTVSGSGRVEAQVSLPAAVVEQAAGKGETVSLPMPALPVTSDKTSAPTVTLSLSSGSAARVEIPVADVTPGTVAILVKADGTEELIKTALVTTNGLSLALEDGATVKVVDNSRDFEDVPEHHWGSGFVDFATSRGLFAGTGETTFAPDLAMNRAMIVTVLASFHGVDTTAGSTWYEAGLQWAVEAGISDGSDPEGALTREQLAVMLWRSAGSPETSGGMDRFADSGSVSAWAAPAMAWAVEQGMISGTDTGHLLPQGEASRVQVAAILMRYVETQYR